MHDRRAPWALILAGGDGVRLQSLTRLVAGDPRPKQFCTLLAGETLLERTRRRVDLHIGIDRQVIAVTRSHEPHYRYLSDEVLPGRLLVQPENRDTAPAILYALLRIRHLAGDVPVAVFPSDHHVGDDELFVGYVRRALHVVEMRPALVALVGIEPSSPESDYGWIEPAPVSLSTSRHAFPVVRFVEKPSASEVRELIARGCLWNSFVMTGRVDTFLDLIARTVSDLFHAFDTIREVLGTPAEDAELARVYASLPKISFARHVLARARGHLVTVRARGVEWSDWGSPRRVVASMREMQADAPWLRGAEALGGERGMRETG